MPGLIALRSIAPLQWHGNDAYAAKNVNNTSSTLSNVIAPIQGRDPIYRVRAPAPFMGEGRVPPRVAMNIDRVVGAQWSESEFAIPHNDVSINLYRAIGGDYVDMDLGVPISASKLRIRVAKGDVEPGHLFVLQEIAA